LNPAFTLRQLEYAVAIADLGSFQRAARACHVTQPGLSAQIRQLEELVGVRLFERDRRRVFVTPAGEELIRRARRVLAEAEGIVDAAQSLHAPLCGTLRLGVIPTIAPYLLPQVLPRVRRRHPQLRLRLHEARTAELVALLRRGELDLLLLALEAPLDGLETRPLFSDPFVFAAARGHRLAGRARVRESDLEGERVLLLEDGHCLREQALAACQGMGAEEIGDFRASSLATLVEMVAGGAGATLLPELSVDAARRGRTELALLPFVAPAPARTIGLAWRPTSGRGAEFELLAKLLVEGRQRSEATREPRERSERRRGEPQRASRRGPSTAS
jgi:LysR family hydrogen peroxide-inducible transcriptional activator